MKLELRLDYDGNPYIELLSENDDNAENQLLELFIRKAKEKGVVVVNEADSETRNDYASIKIK